MRQFDIHTRAMESVHDRRCAVVARGLSLMRVEMIDESGDIYERTCVMLPGALERSGDCIVCIESITTREGGGSIASTPSQIMCTSVSASRNSLGDCDTGATNKQQSARQSDYYSHHRAIEMQDVHRADAESAVP